MATKSVFSNFPDEAFPIGTGLGNKSSGGAVAFQISEDCRLTGISLLLKSFIGVNKQRICVELYGNLAIASLNKPDAKISSLQVPAPNDGSAAEFVCSLPAPVSLAKDCIYWLLVYGELTELAMQTGVKASWLIGGAGMGSAVIVESAGFINGNFVRSNLTPAFSLRVTG